MTSRRDFIKKSLAGGAALLGLGIPLKAFARKEDIIRITILHTNDTHSRIDPFPDNDPKYPGMGGTARRAAVIKKIRSEEENVLLLDSGDFFQGTPYFNLYGGELELKLMSQMGYDAATIGNHDFDNGVDGLAKQLVHASFPLLSANYDFSGTSLEGKTIPYKIFNKGGVKIGVFGLGIELEGLVDKKLYGKTVYLDPIEKAAEISHLLKQEKKCDLIICLSHLGDRYENNKVSDVVLAKKSKCIDLILGGHTHRFMDKPLTVKNSDDKDVLISQVGFAGIRLGRIDYFFELKTKKKSLETATIKISKKSIGV